MGDDRMKKQQKYLRKTIVKGNIPSCGCGGGTTELEPIERADVGCHIRGLHQTGDRNG